MDRVSMKGTIIALLFSVLLLAIQGCGGAGEKTKGTLMPEGGTIDKLWRGFVEDVTQ
jgi:hypothetical protein